MPSGYPRASATSLAGSPRVLHYASLSLARHKRDILPSCAEPGCSSVSVPSHTFGADCPHCGDGAAGVRCDLRGYSPRRVRFILAHCEAYEAAYFNPGRSAASHEQERLEREFRTSLAGDGGRAANPPRRGPSAPPGEVRWAQRTRPIVQLARCHPGQAARCARRRAKVQSSAR